MFPIGRRTHTTSTRFDDGLQIELEECVPVTESRPHLRFLVKFSGVLSYQSYHECYSKIEDIADEVGGVIFSTIESKYLKFLGQASLVLDIHPDDCPHYVLLTSNFVFDVVATSAPQFVALESIPCPLTREPEGVVEP